jgi:phospholipid/cholesterol/gamma-HCH transport system substrate-binding protein
MTRKAAVQRIAVLAALAASVTAVAVLLLGGADYRVHARFQNASGLVKGGLVEVAGRKVGTVSKMTVTADGEADVLLSLDDDSVTPLRDGTRATVRALGQAGITSHYVDLSPGPVSARELPDGGVLPTTQTTSMVNLDALLDSFGPVQRTNLRRLIASSADVFAGSGASTFNDMLGRVDPAMREVAATTEQIAGDRASLERVITAGDSAASAIASRRTDLQEALANTTRALEGVAHQRAALADLLDRTPSALAVADRTLADASSAVTALRPTLHDVPAAARPLATLLHRLREVLPEATPVVRRLNDQLPDLRRGLAGLRPLRRPAVRALRSAARALNVARPIVRGARIYGSDFVLGILGGLIGAGAYNHDRWGHYERLDFVQPLQASIGGLGSELLSKHPLIPGILDLRTHQLRRCPGGNVPPAIDGSSPWVADPALCDPSQDIPASVNEP